MNKDSITLLGNPSDKESETRECKTYTLAKKYKDMDDLLQDNDKEIYFDKQLDPTQYDIYNGNKQRFWILYMGLFSEQKNAVCGLVATGVI